MRPSSALLLLLLVGGCAAPPKAPERPDAATGVIGVQANHLDPEFWVARAPDADAVLLDRAQIAAQNERLEQLDPSVRDLEQLPARLSGADVREMIAGLSARPERTLYDVGGAAITPSQLDQLERNVNLQGVGGLIDARYGLIVRRADLRTFPTRLRVFSSPDDSDIDRFQESALFPGTPVVIVHESADGEWLFVVSALYAAWVEKRYVAEGPAAQVFAYARKSPSLIVTGAAVRTVYTPERPEVSELQLDMGVRAPLLADWPPGELVNGQHPYTGYVIELPVRTPDGALAFAPALVPRIADVSTDYLPLNRANLLRQSFKFLGERYGWGHSYNARDCSGFVSEVYRSFGVTLPRNTRDQAVSPALNRTELTASDDRARRLAALESLEPGDLIYIPGHVMMAIGRVDGVAYVIHDTTGVSYRRADGEIERVRLNGVAVTPLDPMLVGGKPLADAVRSIVRIRP